MKPLAISRFLSRGGRYKAQHALGLIDAAGLKDVTVGVKQERQDLMDMRVCSKSRE